VHDPDTVSELRAHYRAAEARAARLRLLIEAGRDLSAANAQTLDALLASAGRRAALFCGCTDGYVTLGPDAPGLDLIAPGANSRKVGGLLLQPPGRAAQVVDLEDAEALGMLRQLMAAAIDRVGRDGERDHLLGLLRERERRLESLVARLFSAQEDERRRVSRELHDGVAQSAGALFRQIEAQKTGASPEAVAKLAGMAKGLMRELRAAIADMRPTALDDLGLIAAVTSLADSVSARGYDVELFTTGPDRWPSTLETAFFRVAQEALNNVVRHSGGPCRVNVGVRGDPKGGRWELVVRDWGVGFGEEPSGMSPGDHIGLEVMRERMIAIGGRLGITSPQGGGVEIVASLETPS
jgi:two-component system, NarL family, sensor kinase